MSDELPTAEQVAQMRAQIDAFDTARREEMATQVDEKLAALLELTGNTLTADLADVLDQQSRGDAVTEELAQLLTATARCVRVIPRALDGAREQAIAKLKAEDTTKEPAAE